MAARPVERSALMEEARSLHQQITDLLSFMPQDAEPSYIGMEDDYFSQETQPKQPVPGQISWEPVGITDEREGVQPPREQSTPRGTAETAGELPKSRMTEEPELTLGLSTVKNAVDTCMEALS